jgi:hypothetical protein
MSAWGQKRRFDCQPITSGLPLINGHSQSPSACLKGAITGPTRRLSECEGKRSIFRTRQTGSVDDLIRPFEQLWRNRHTNCPSRLEIEHQYMLREDLDRQVARFGAP